MWIWAATHDLKAKVPRGEQFHDIRGPVVLVLFAAVVLITIAAFYLNAGFAFAISRPGPPYLRAGFGQARRHVMTVTGWGTSIGLALAVAAILAMRWGKGWFTLLLGIVLLPRRRGSSPLWAGSRPQGHWPAKARPWSLLPRRQARQA